MSNYKIAILIEAQNKAFKEIEGLKKQLASIKKPIDEASKSSENFLGGITKLSKSANLAIAGISAVGVGAIANLGISMTQTAGRFEKFQSILTNTLGSVSEAKDAMALLKEVSSQTPFELDRLTESYIKLANRGFKPNRDQIVQLGDLASALGKDFDQLVEAMLDAQTGEFERLKEFGVRAQASGDQVQFTFKGVTSTVAKTDEAIKNYVLGLGKLQGVQGSMITQSNTYEGKISNLKDARTNLSATIGSEFLPMAKNTVSGITDIINKLNKSVKTVTDRGDSTNENVVLVADSFEYLKRVGKAIGGLGDYFHISFGSIAKSIISLNPFISIITEKLSKLLGLANISVGSITSSIVGKVKNAMGVTKKAIENNIAQTQVINPTLSMERLKDGLQKGKVQISEVMKDISKDIDKVPGLNMNKLKSGGSSNKDAEKEKTIQLKQEQELVQITQKRIESINALGISESKKAQLTIQANDEMTKQLKVIRGDDKQDTIQYLQEIADKSKQKIENIKDGFKSIYEAVKNSISKSKDEVAKLDEKIKDSTDRIKELQKSISDLNIDTQKSLTDRFIEATKEMSETQKALSKPVDNMEDSVALQNKVQDLRQELALIATKVSDSDLKKATEFDKLSPAQKIIENAKVKKDEYQALIDSENEKVKLLEDQRKDEMVKMQNFNIAKQKIEAKYTKMYKDELQDRTNAYSNYISTIASLGGGSTKDVVSQTNEAISGLGVSSVVATKPSTGTRILNIPARAMGGPVQGGDPYWVGEKGPELYVPKGSGNIIPNNKLGGINININGVSINNGMDLNNFKDIIEATIVKSVRNVQAGIY